MKRVIALSAFTVILAGCAEGPGRPLTGTGAATSVAKSNTPVAETAADVARVVCDEDAVSIEDPVVRARRDGVHFAVANPGRMWGLSLHHESWGRAAEEIYLSEPPKVTDPVSAIGPGDITVACLPTRTSAYWDPEALTAVLTVVDPDGYYVPWDLACGSGEQFRMTIPAGREEDPASALRRVPGVVPTDEVKRPKYPDSPRYSPMEFILFRNGQAVARVMGPYYDEAWHVLINACPGSGISKH